MEQTTGRTSRHPQLMYCLLRLPGIYDVIHVQTTNAFYRPSRQPETEKKNESVNKIKRNELDKNVL